ncbi:MAG: NAD(P)-binding domain-containing protein [Actinomycetota bacterium]
MGSNLAHRLLQDGEHECVVYDRDATIVKALADHHRLRHRRSGPFWQKGGIRLLDCGTSGGVWGSERGYSLMIGGEADAFAQVEPVFATLAPGVGCCRTYAHGHRGTHGIPRAEGRLARVPARAPREAGLLFALAQRLSLLVPRPARLGSATCEGAAPGRVDQTGPVSACRGRGGPRPADG